MPRMAFAFGSGTGASHPVLQGKFEYVTERILLIR